MIRAERLEIRNVKFKRCKSKQSEDIAQQSREILQRFVCLGARGTGGGGGGGGAVRARYHTNVCKFLQICEVISSLVFKNSLSNLATLLIWGVLFSRVDGFSPTSPSQKFMIVIMIMIMSM